MKNTYFALLLSALFVLPNKVIAWGEKGHNLVAEIAFLHLKENTQKKVLHYLEGMTIQEAANWMDVKRSDCAYNFMKPFHYVNYEIESAVTELPGNNIINSIEGAIHKLENYENLTSDELKYNLLLLFHLIGDLHQPLHVGYGTDKGGNKIQVRYCGKGTNLHKLWDTDIIKHKNLTLEECLNAYEYTKEELKTIQKKNVLQWAEESRSNLKSVYDFEGHKIKDEYVDVNFPLIKLQIQKAGLRLAGILTSVFEK
jgi:hypothetical protein